MAINPEAQYPGKINPADGDYPYGSARNVALPGDGTGTPWEAALVNDLIGLQQALLDAAAIVPSGTPDKVGASQYFDAIAKVAGKNSGLVFATKAALAANTPIGGKSITLEPGMGVHTLGFNTAGDGGGAAYIIESGTSGVNDLTVIQTGSNKATRLPGQFNFSCGWIWDDGYASHKTVVVPLFESKGVYCGFAPHTIAIDGVNRLTSTDIIDLNARGWEFINHSYSHPTMGNDKENQFVKAEVDTAWAFFEKLGIGINSWLTPSSVLGSTHLGIIRQRYNFAFTRGTSLVAMRDVDPFLLRRVGIESFTTEQCKEALDDALVFGGSAIFYAHDVTNGDAIYNRAADLLDYAAEIGVPVKLPTGSVRDGVVGFHENGSEFISGRTIWNRREGWSATNGATVTVGSNKDITVEATAPGQSLVQRMFVTNMENLGSLVFSGALRTLAGSIGSANTIGLKISNETNTTTLFQIEETIGDLDTQYRRYNLVGQSYRDKVTVLLYFRVDFTAAADRALIRDPILRYGTDVNPEVQKLINESFTFGLPSQTIANGGYSVNNTLTLTNQADNGVFKIDANRIKFTKSTRVSLSVSVVSYGTNSLLNSEGGMLFLDYGVDFVQSSISTGPHTGGGNIDITLDVDAAQNIRLALFNVAKDFTVSNLHSKVVIRELLE